MLGVLMFSSGCSPACCVVAVVHDQTCLMALSYMALCVSVCLVDGADKLGGDGHALSVH